MTTKIKVQITDNGPLVVSGHASVRFCGELIDVPDTAYLCRCGGSANPPFCDGTHNKNGFDGTAGNKDSRPVKEWVGKTVKTRFDANLCMHAFECQPLKALREKELAGDASAADEIARVVSECPSGALTYEMMDAQSSVSYVESADIEIMEGAEIRIRTEVDCEQLSVAGKAEQRTTLCRCGLSKNKPFCDASHRKKDGFR